MPISTEELQREAFFTLTGDEIAQLMPYGERRATRAGDVLFEAGDGAPVLVVVLAGRTEVIDRSDGSDRVISPIGPGQFSGELGLLTGQTVYANCIVREPGAVLIVPAAGVQEVIATSPTLGNALVTAFSARRQLLMQAAGPTLTIIGAAASPKILDLEEFVTRNRIPHRWLANEDPAAVALMQRTGASGDAEVWVVLRGQKALADPSPIYLAKALGLDLAIGQTAPADLVVVGAGPAGLSAAVYGASEGLDTIVVEDVAIGGQAGSSSRIENYLGFPAGISGGDLAFRAEVQALKFGARVTVPRGATGLRADENLFEIQLDGMKSLRARSVVIATGARYRRLGLEHQDRFEGAGVYYAATDIEARLCRKQDVAVVGAGNSAGQAALFLAESARRVHLICRGPDLGQTMSSYLIARLEHAPNISIHTTCVVSALHGRDRLESVTVEKPSGVVHELQTCALFVMIGADPHTDWLRGTLKLDDRGFVVTGIAALEPGRPLSDMFSLFQTSVSGVFAVGDVRSGSVKRVASAVGEGSVVVSAVHRYLAARGGEAP